jgi:TonB family protein
MHQSRKLRPEFSEPAEESVPRVPASPQVPEPFDALLNNIVQQCRYTTRATGAAIAIAAGDAMVCRATTGGHAPDLGVKLDTQSGLSGACVRSRAVQICDDTELDPRVDVAACRALGVRSILVVPLLRGGRLLGVMELFSPVVKAFGERDVQTMEAYAQRILDAMNDAPTQEVPMTHEEQAPIPVPASLLPDAAPVGLQLEDSEPEAKRRDWLTTILTGLVIALSIVLGALLGMHRMRAQRVPRTPSTVAVSAVAAQASDANSVPVNSTASILPVTPSLAKSSKAVIDVGTDKPPQDAAGGLTVYQNGHAIFHEPPLEGDTASATSANQPANLSPDIAERLLLSRVEPVYPPSAIASRVQGPVRVRVTVDAAGAVMQARVFSGPPELAQAAVDAVKQWRFRPYTTAGQAQAFRTVTTIDFKLR